MRASARVVYAVADPNPRAPGGAAILADAGWTSLHAPTPTREAVNARWLTCDALGRPYVIAKWAQTLDGRTAAADGTSFWITGERPANTRTESRASVDAIVVGTGTVLVDDPVPVRAPRRRSPSRISPCES